MVRRAGGGGPTGLAIDTTNHLLFSGGGKFTVVLDAKTGKVVAQMPICDGTDATWFDAETSYVFTSCSNNTWRRDHDRPRGLPDQADGWSRP